MTKKKEHILKVALDLFSKQGYSGTSVRNIADTAEVNLSMISYYFGGKEGLLTALVNEGSKSMYIEFDQFFGNEKLSSIEKLDCLVDNIVDKFWENRVMYNIIIREQNFQANQELKDIIEQLKITRYNHFKEIIEEGQRKGVFHKDANIALMHANVISMMKHIYFSGEHYYQLLEISTAENRDELLLDNIRNYIKSNFKLILNDKQN